MPVIKRGNRLVGAADAAATFDQATSGQRDTTLAVARLRQQQQQFELAQAQRADYQNQQRENQDRSYELQSRRLEAANNSGIRNQLGRTSEYGGAGDGRSMIQMATRISQLDRNAYGEMEQQFDAMTGGVFNEQNPLSAAKLDAHPKREAIYSLLGQYLLPLEKRADGQAVQHGFRDLEQNVGLMGGDWLKTADGVQWQSGLEVDLANAKQGGGGINAAKANAIYEEHQAKANAKIDLHRRREHYRDQWDSVRTNPKYADKIGSDEWQRAVNEAAGFGSSLDPKTKFVRAMTHIDGDFQLAAQMAYEDGRNQGALGAMAAEQRRQGGLAPPKSTVGVEGPGRGTDHDLELYARKRKKQLQGGSGKAGTSIGTSNRPGLYNALGLNQADASTGKMADFAQSIQLDPDNPEAFDAAIRRFLTVERMADERSSERYGARIK